MKNRMQISNKSHPKTGAIKLVPGNINSKVLPHGVAEKPDGMNIFGFRL